MRILACAVANCCLFKFQLASLHQTYANEGVGVNMSVADMSIQAINEGQLLVKNPDSSKQHPAFSEASAGIENVHGLHGQYYEEADDHISSMTGT